MSEEQLVGLIGRQVNLYVAGDNNWRSYNVDEIAAMLSADSPRALGEHEDAWRLIKGVCEGHARQLRYAAGELAKQWPPRQNEAAYLFLEYVEHLASVMVQTAEAAVYNQQALTAFADTLAAARTKVEQIRDQKAVDPVGDQGRLSRYDQQAQAVMLGVERDLVQAAWHTREPTHHNVGFFGEPEPWPPAGRSAFPTPVAGAGAGSEDSSSFQPNTIRAVSGGEGPSNSTGAAPSGLVRSPGPDRVPRDLDGLAAGGARYANTPSGDGQVPERHHEAIHDPVAEPWLTVPTSGSERPSVPDRRRSGKPYPVGGWAPFADEPRSVAQAAGQGAVIGQRQPSGGKPSGSGSGGLLPPTGMVGMQQGRSPKSVSRYRANDDGWELPTGHPPVIDAPPEPSFHDPGPGVIGLDR